MSENSARGFNRRLFLKGTAAASLGTAAAAAGVTPAGVSTAAAAELPPTPPHGAELRGMDLVVKEPHGRGSIRVHVQEPAAVPGRGYAAQ